MGILDNFETFYTIETFFGNEFFSSHKIMKSQNCTTLIIRCLIFIYYNMGKTNQLRENGSKTAIN